MASIVLVKSRHTIRQRFFRRVCKNLYSSESRLCSCSEQEDWPRMSRRPSPYAPKPSPPPLAILSWSKTDQCGKKQKVCFHQRTKTDSRCNLSCVDDEDVAWDDYVYRLGGDDNNRFNLVSPNDDVLTSLKICDQAESCGNCPPPPPIVDVTRSLCSFRLAPDDPPRILRVPIGSGYRSAENLYIATNVSHFSVDSDGCEVNSWGSTFSDEELDWCPTFQQMEDAVNGCCRCHDVPAPNKCKAVRNSDNASDQYMASKVDRQRKSVSSMAFLRSDRLPTLQSSRSSQSKASMLQTSTTSPSKAATSRPSQKSLSSQSKATTSQRSQTTPSKTSVKKSDASRPKPFNFLKSPTGNIRTYWRFNGNWKIAVADAQTSTSEVSKSVVFEPIESLEDPHDDSNLNEVSESNGADVWNTADSPPRGGSVTNDVGSFAPSAAGSSDIPRDKSANANSGTTPVRKFASLDPILNRNGNRDGLIPDGGSIQGDRAQRHESTKDFNSNHTEQSESQFDNANASSHHAARSRPRVDYDQNDRHNYRQCYGQHYNHRNHEDHYNHQYHDNRRHYHNHDHVRQNRDGNSSGVKKSVKDVDVFGDRGLLVSGRGHRHADVPVRDDEHRRLFADETLTRKRKPSARHGKTTMSFDGAAGLSPPRAKVGYARRRRFCDGDDETSSLSSSPSPSITAKMKTKEKTTKPFHGGGRHQGSSAGLRQGTGVGNPDRRRSLIVPETAATSRRKIRSRQLEHRTDLDDEDYDASDSDDLIELQRVVKMVQQQHHRRQPEATRSENGRRLRVDDDDWQECGYRRTSLPEAARR